MIYSLAEKLKHFHHQRENYVARYSSNRTILIFLIIILMTISQMAISIYLPSLPAMVKSLHTHQTWIQLSISVFIFSYGCSQFFYGPFSDIFGRRKIVLIGLSIFVAASILAVITTNITLFLIARVLQGIGMGCGDTMGRAILCDRFEGSNFVRAAAYIGMASTLMPIFAPVLGGYLQVFIGWRANFAFLLLYSFASFLIFYFKLPETNPYLKKRRFSLKLTIYRYLHISKNQIFLAFFIPGLVCFFGETVYNMISPFLFQNILGVNPVTYGWLAIYMVAGLLIGTLISKQLSEKINHYHMVLAGLWLLIIASLVLLTFAVLHYLNLWVVIVPLIFFMIGIGVIYPNTNMGALMPFAAMAGTAGALQGGLQMLFGGFLTLLIANIHSKTQMPLAIILAVAAIIGLILFLYFSKAHKAAIH